MTKSAKSAAGAHRLEPLARAYWDAYLQQSPLFATAIGVRGYDDRLSDITPEGRAAWIAKLEALYERTLAIPEEGLRPGERTTRSELIMSISTDLDWARSDVDEWTVDPLNGPVVSFLNVESYQPLRTAVDGRRMVTRWGAMASYLDDHIANLRRGLQAGRVAVHSGVLKVIEQIEDLAADLRQPAQTVERAGKLVREVLEHFYSSKRKAPLREPSRSGVAPSRGRVICRGGGGGVKVRIGSGSVMPA